MIFTVTERGIFKRCRRRWDYSSLNRQALTPIMGSPNLSLGLIIHKALEDWTNNFINPYTDDTLEVFFMKASLEELTNVKERYKENVGAYPSDVELAHFYELVMLGKAMAANYEAYYGVPIPDGFDLVKSEQQLVVKVPGTVHKLEAKLDKLLVQKSTNKLFILDHKTFSAHPKESAVQQNDQFLAYLWAVRQTYGAERVGGFIYDGLWKRAQPPKNRSVADLFTRIVTYRPESELKEFEHNLSAELKEMGSTFTRIYPNRQWQGCWDCPFDKLCAMQSRGENWQFHKQLHYTKRLRDIDLEVFDAEGS